MAASFGQDYSGIRVHTRSDAAVRRAAKETIDLSVLAMAELADSEPRPVVQILHKEVSVLRQAISVQRRPCPPYNGYSTAIPLRSYNCAGLAHRTYDYNGLPGTNALLAAEVQCAAGKVKHWLWEYDLRLENEAGGRSPISRDFHAVAGVIRPVGADPVDVFTKNGARRVYGPGTGPSFRPPARDRALTNDPDEAPATDGDGNPLFKVRSNFTTTTRCLNCPSGAPPRQGPPPP